MAKKTKKKDEGKYDALCLFYWHPTHLKWTISLYSQGESVDVSVIAKAHGGGGHKGAAGFRAEELPFQLGGKPK